MRFEKLSNLLWRVIVIKSITDLEGIDCIVLAPRAFGTGAQKLQPRIQRLDRWLATLSEQLSVTFEHIEGCSMDI